MRKTIVIGLDAGCLDNIMPWVKQGELPCLGQLLADGLYSELRSIIPSFTAPAWTSMFTGKNPGKHGIFSFFKYRNHSYVRDIVSAHDIRAKSIWEYLAECGKTSIVINVPLTHPARKMRGIVIPGFMAPDIPTCFPANILQELAEAQINYQIYSNYEGKLVSPEKKVQGYIAVAETRKKATLYLAQKYDWDFLFVQFQETDSVFHQFGKSEHSLRLYRYVDKCVGELVAELGSGVDVLIVSDHGIGKIKWRFCLNSWLKKEGLLRVKRGERKEISSDHARAKRYATTLSRIASCLSRIGVTSEEIFQIAIKLKLGFLRGLIPRQWLEQLPKKQIDWGKTKAYCPSASCWGIRINVKDREPEGIVEKGEEYQALRQNIIEKLQRLRDPEGELVFDKVLPREEYYSGTLTNQALDIIFATRNTDYAISDIAMRQVFSPFGRCGHKRDGLFIANGPSIKHAGLLKYKLDILDITPTILHMFGLPIPDDIDGRVLAEIFKPDSDPARRGVTYKATGEKRKVKEKIGRLKGSGKI